MISSAAPDAFNLPEGTIMNPEPRARLAVVTAGTSKQLRSAGAPVSAQAVRSALTARGALVSVDETLRYFEHAPAA